MNALEIKNVSKIYEGFKLDNVSLSLPEGCILGLIGENGAGKSTLIRIIMGITKSDGGEIRILGRDGKKEIELVKEDIGFVPDNVGLPGFMNMEQIGSFMAGNYKNWDGEKYEQLLEKFDMNHDRKFKDFSKGMRMKAGLAVAMSHGAKLLILDEATSGLDPVIRDEILDIFLEFTREPDHSVLISSHIVSDLEKLCDYIAFLHKGKIMLFEEKDALKEEYALVKCGIEELDGVSEGDIIGKKVNPYGAEAIIKRSAVKKGMNISNVDIEQLFIFMAKEGEK